MAHPDTAYDQTAQGLSWWWIIFMFLLIIAGSAFFIVPNFMRARTGSFYTQCQSNCKNMGIALKMYYDDNNGEYPRTLTTLMPDYLRVMPTCAGSGSSRGYIESYQVSEDLKAYTFYCKGRNHFWIGLKKNYPQYSSREGLKARP